MPWVGAQEDPDVWLLFLTIGELGILRHPLSNSLSHAGAATPQLIQGETVGFWRRFRPICNAAVNPAALVYVWSRKATRDFDCDDRSARREAYSPARAGKYTSIEKRRGR